MNHIKMPQHSVAKSIVLHLLPGVAAVLAFIGISAALQKYRLPPLFVLNIALAAAIIPIELGILVSRSRKTDGSILSKGIIGFLAPLKWYEYALYGALALAWPVAIFTTVGSALNNLLAEGVFTWLPAWFQLGDYLINPDAYTRSIRIATWVLTIVFGSLIGPAVEELYFRGYLLSRINRFGIAAPVIGTVLFAVYHFWSPSLILTRIIAVLPLSYLVWKKKNVYIGIIAHCLLNLVGDSILAIPAVFG
jgi:membrane protease YdiL (CAAX protease family)